MQGRIAEHKTGRMMFKQWRALPEFRSNRSLFIADKAAGVLIHPLKIVLFGQDIGAVRLPVGRRVVKEILVVTKRVFVKVGWQGLEGKHQTGSFLNKV